MRARASIKVAGALCVENEFRPKGGVSNYYKYIVSEESGCKKGLTLKVVTINEKGLFSDGRIEMEKMPIFVDGV